MPTFSKVSTLCIVGLLASRFASANPVVVRDDAPPIATKLPEGINTGKCDGSTDWDTPENRKAIWLQANGWELTDAFLEKNSGENGYADHWAQNMYNSIFALTGKTDMDCSSWNADCSVPKDCNEFEEKGYAGLWYVLKSMQNIHTFFEEYQARVMWLQTQLYKDVDLMVDQFKANTDTNGKIGLGSILTGSMVMASAFTGPNPYVTGGLTTLIGLTSIYGAKLNKFPVSSAEKDAKKHLTDFITGFTGEMWKEAEIVRGAVFGTKDGDTYRNEFTEIPDKMKFNEGKNTDPWKHAITFVLGDGQWLLKNPTEDLNSIFEKTYKRARQQMAFQALRFGHGAVVVINDADTDKDKCNGMRNNVWDDEAKPNPYCVGMMWLDEKGSLKGGINDPAYPLWDAYNDGSDDKQDGFGMDKLWTYRNAIDCWAMNNGQAGNLDTSVTIPGTDLDRCTFSMEVKKGKWVDDNDDCWPGATLQLDTGFENFWGESDDWKNKRTHWPQEKSTMSPFCSNNKRSISHEEQL